MISTPRWVWGGNITSGGTPSCMQGRERVEGVEAGALPDHQPALHATPHGREGRGDGGDAALRLAGLSTWGRSPWRYAHRNRIEGVARMLARRKYLIGSRRRAGGRRPGAPADRPAAGPARGRRPRPQGPVKLVLLHAWDEARLPLMEKMRDEFQQRNPRITVDFDLTTTASGHGQPAGAEAGHRGGRGRPAGRHHALARGAAGAGAAGRAAADRPARQPGPVRSQDLLRGGVADLALPEQDLRAAQRLRRRLVPRALQP